MSLNDLYQNHIGKASDKWSFYLDLYDVVFNEFINKPITLLEIGVQNGGSLEIWSKYFPYFEKIIGCDIDKNCRLLTYENPNISIVVGDCNLETTQKKIAEIAALFDIIIDDGSHRSGDIIRSFASFFPKLKNEGFYIVEDIHCSYWKRFEGGLLNALSSIAFFKRIADIINAEHWEIDNNASKLLSDFFTHYDFNIKNEDLACIHSISFYNSVCIIRKKSSNKNILNQRIIAGDSFQICKNNDETEKLKKAFELFKIESRFYQDCLPLENLINQHHHLKKEHQNLIELHQIQLALNKKLSHEKEHLITHQNTLLSSKSWRFTAPIRYINNLLIKLKHKVFRKKYYLI